MKNLLLFMIAFFLCGHLYSQKSISLRKVVSKKSEIGATLPMSVVEIPAGTFFMGNHGDSTSPTSQDQQRPVLISGFYMSATEVTNAQYHEFVNWVRDSIVAKRLGGQYITVAGNDTMINWKATSKINYSDPAILAQLGDLVLDPSKTISQKRMIDPDKLIYALEGFNYQEAAKKENKGRDAKDFVYRYTVQVYPDTLSWMRDFGYSNNEQMAVNYFSSQKYQNYPVVGVSWKQASAYCDWMTKHKILARQSRNRGNGGGKARLPTEAEWEYAASLNAKDAAKEEHRSKQDSDAIASNTKAAVPGEGKIFPVYVRGAKKGDFGLYNLADNVSEWTTTSYYEGGENFQNRFNPDIQWGTPESESRAQRRKVIRGGSWKDTPTFMTPENRSFEDLDASHSYLGFRIVVNMPE
ncbi:T9SS ring complex lipoprotein PorK/GldK [Niabella drilacis]|uniref:Gliding motility-associated lipoprotein GldK n=1 Tax=Niabella drilacis (strain DSM 25811 / CCM 8410 / CCUG 62505 / LMG 26954 / E90) TaxID=1285928 RepID=A0A1G6IAX3_NIADE|nr:SUMF1/EgtB/PvdO family nonheme iron enzyme [Niabella drilacis]SDC03621.1 gliding motility-associated lipoprotein GldK [Niabella drilacis]